MFWKGKIPILTHLNSYLSQKDLELAVDLPVPTLPTPLIHAKCTVAIASVDDRLGISRLLNDWFERGRVKANTTPEWIQSTFLKNDAIWVVAKDSGGTIRACISSFSTVAPYPNSLSKCGQMPPWGIVDWFCVHPLWRGKGVATNILETLDFITYSVGRKAHVFLKEGTPLPFPQIPVYSTMLKFRRAGTDKVKYMRQGTGLGIYDYHSIERSTGISMVRVEGLTTDRDLQEWEDALDNELPPSWVFVNGSSIVDPSRGWKSDSLVSMYAFRWIPGKWLFKKPTEDIV